jgi:hypothetical protein
MPGIAAGNISARPATPCVAERHRLINVEWFRQVFEGAALIGRDCAVEIRMRRHHDDR